LFGANNGEQQQPLDVHCSRFDKKRIPFFSDSVIVFLACLPVNLNLEVVLSRANSTTTTETKRSSEEVVYFFMSTGAVSLSPSFLQFDYSS
jgi:hypothetical protein